METIVNLIGNTTTKTGLSVQCVVDTNTYPMGLKISDDQIFSLIYKLAVAICKDYRAHVFLQEPMYFYKTSMF